MRDITRRAKKRLSALESTAAEQFESSIIHNRVHEVVREDDGLRHVLDVTELAYELEERDGLPDEMELVSFNAAEDLNGHVDALVERVVARECSALIEDACGGWFGEVDYIDEIDIRDASNEAYEWLAEHSDAAEAEGIDVEMIWGASDVLEVTSGE